MSTTRAKRLRKSSGTLATVLASAALARVITHFVLHPDVALHFQALRRVTGLSSQSLQHELARLEALGLIDREQDGRLVRYRAARGDARWRTFRDLVARLADPAEVLRVALSELPGELPGVDAAFIYGSYARGTAVHEDSDVDVFVVGEDLDDERVRLGLAERTLAVSGLLGREVNVTRYTYDRLAKRSAEGRRFVREVLAGDKDWLVGREAMLPAPPNGTRHSRGQA
jgi:predicted nucleotidyltransferase